MGKESTGVTLYKMVKHSVYYDAGDFNSEEEWLKFLAGVTADPEKADEAYDNGDNDCGSDDGIEDYKTFVEVQYQEGDETSYELINPDNE
jgi:hypothetical protein